MNIVVQKYGGTSVSNKEKIKKICNKIISYVKKGIKVVVVVSAQGKTTDNLICKAKAYSKDPEKKALDLLLTTGETKTVALLSMMLNEKGYDTVGLNISQTGIISDSTYGNATIKNIYTDTILNYLNEGKIVIVPGFGAVDRFGNITTLGRGGSDLSAVAIASAIKAKKCEIYSDVDGIFSTDPKIISKAKLLKNVSYNEMLEAASSGAKVLHNRSVNVAKKNNIPIFVKNSQTQTSGSVVITKKNDEKIESRKDKNYEQTKKDNENKDFEDYKVKFIAKKDNVSKISIIGDMIMSNKDIVHKIFDIAYELDINIYMVSFSELAINIVTDLDKSNVFIQHLHLELIEKEEN